MIEDRYVQLSNTVWYKVPECIHYGCFYSLQFPCHKTLCPVRPQCIDNCPTKTKEEIERKK